MEILARFTHDHVDHTKDNTVHLVVSLKAPTLDWVSKRPKLCVLPVVDLSGSMQGPKLKYAQQSLLKLVDQLAEGDFAGLIGFESQTHVLVEPQPVTSDLKDRLKKAINGLRVMGGTNFAGGMLGAVQAVQKLDLSPSFLKRVIMFTDGQPTEGVVDPKAILKLLDTSRGSVTISAFGYGVVGGGTYGGCDQDFLTEFADLGKGNYAYVQNPDDALGAFGKELGGLLSTYATDLELEIEPANGTITKVVSDTPFTKEKVTGTHEIPIQDILSEESRHFVFEAQLAKTNKVFPRETTIFDVRLTYSVLTEDGKKETRKEEARARVRFVKPEDAQKEPIKEVVEIVNLHRVIRAQLEAEAQAKAGNYDQAVRHMQNIAQEVKTSGGIHLGDAAMQVAARIGSQHLYTSNQGYLRSFAKGGTRGYGVSAVDKDAAQVLMDCSVSLSNAAQTETSTVFTGAPQPNAAFSSTPNAGVLPLGPAHLVNPSTSNKSG